MCKYCEKRFARPGDLKQHTYIHTNERNLLCSVCSKVFHRQQNLNKHMKIHSSDGKHLPCLQCGKGFPDKYHRTRHNATCKGIKTVSHIQSETGIELGLSTAKKRVEKRDCQQSQLQLDSVDAS